jgi:replicative superfamily II helicase
MSILGIRNQLRDLGLRLQYTPEKSEDVLGAAAMVEDAMRDWERKYPADPWLAKSVYDLTDLYARVHTAQGHKNAMRALRWLLNRYGHTAYGHQARLRIQPQVGLR